MLDNATKKRIDDCRYILLFGKKPQRYFVTSEAEPEFIQENMFRTIIYRSVTVEKIREKTVGKTSEEFGKIAERIRKDYGKTALDIFLQINDNPYIKTSELKDLINKSSRTIEIYIAKLKKANIIERKGPKLGGYWEIKIDDN